MTFDLAQLVTGIPDTDEYVKLPGQWRRQGRNGPPVVTDRDGIAVKSGPRAGQVRYRIYSRPSSYGKQVENTYNLNKWSERMVARGLAVSWRGAEDVICDLLLHGDPEDPAWKTMADGVVVEAKRRAGATLAADRGTHGHTLTEDHDLEQSIITRLAAGEDLGLPVNLQHGVVDCWMALTSHWFDVVAVEFPCVYDRWKVAGTGDRIVRLRHDMTFVVSDGSVVFVAAGTVIVLDIKTGRLTIDRDGLPRYWHNYAVQVAAYANAVPYDVDTEQRGTWAHQPSTNHGIIAHIDIRRALETGTVVGQLIYVDLAAGYQAGELVSACKMWQRRNDLFTPVDQHCVSIALPKETTPSPATTTSGSTSSTASSPSETATAAPSSMTVDDVLSQTLSKPSPPNGQTSSTPPIITSNGTPTVTTDADTATNPVAHIPDIPSKSDGKSDGNSIRSDLAARARHLIDTGHGERLARAWPLAIPGFKTEHRHTDAELDAIRQVIHAVEIDTHAPFHPDDATLPSKPHWDVTPPPAPTIPPPIVEAVATGLAEGETWYDGRQVAEGDHIDADHYTALKEQFERLDIADQFRIEAIVAQANRAGRSIALTEHATSRRYEIARALIYCCRAQLTNDDIGDLCACVMDHTWSRTTPLGAVVGALTVGEARRLAAMAALPA